MSDLHTADEEVAAEMFGNSMHDLSAASPPDNSMPGGDGGAGARGRPCGQAAPSSGAPAGSSSTLSRLAPLHPQLHQPEKLNLEIFGLVQTYL